VSSKMRRLSCALILIALAAPIAAQEPAFEVASIRPTPDVPPAAGAAGVHITKQQVRFAYLSLRDYISIAYTLPVHLISGPDWINTTRFDIAAKLPEGLAEAQFPQLLQTLLRDRFKLQAHREKRESPVYVLEVAPGGHKLVAVTEDENLKDAPFTVTSSGGPEGVSADLGQGASFSFTPEKFEVKKVGMEALVNTLGRFMDRPILDLTKLDGRYNITFPVTREEFMPMLVRSAVNAGVTLPPQALQLLESPAIGSGIDGLKAVGLLLEARKAPLDMLVIDSMERTPTEN
jgi:uncharacterized protein (TIGR03435 family)